MKSDEIKGWFGSADHRHERGREREREKGGEGDSSEAQSEQILIYATSEISAS